MVVSKYLSIPEFGSILDIRHVYCKVAQYVFSICSVQLSQSCRFLDNFFLIDTVTRILEFYVGLPLILEENIFDTRFFFLIIH